LVLVAVTADAVFVAVAAVMTVFAAYEVLFTLSYEAQVEGETIEFRALARRRRVSVRAIQRISTARTGDTTRFKVQFEGGSTKLAYCRSSRAFVAAIAHANRVIETEGFDRYSGERTKRWW
jgi:hypothetical protein